jgi:hypothetical protein
MLETNFGSRNRRRRVSPSGLCRRLDLLPQNFFNWADQGLLTKAGPAGCSLLDGIELAVFLKLKEKLGLRRMKQLWAAVREQLRQRLPAGEVFMVYDQEADRIMVALTHDEVGQLVCHGGIVRVIPAADYISRIREAFEKTALKSEAEQPNLRPNRRTRGQPRKG